MEPDHLGCTISSQLLTSDIWIPVRKITEDTVNTILNRFLEVAQSKEQEGITLWVGFYFDKIQPWFIHRNKLR